MRLIVRIGCFIATVLLCLSTTGCESMIDGIADNITHDSDVRGYQHQGMSHREAERRVYEDNYFDRMDGY